jgi:hypothetical protein
VNLLWEIDYPYKGVEAHDCNKNSVPLIIGGDTVDIRTAGNYVVTYDAAGAQQKTHTVIVTKLIQ